MGTPSKVLLTLAAVCLPAGLLIVTGVISAKALPDLHVVLPLGAILFGLFLLSRILEKEPLDSDTESHTSDYGKAPKPH